MSEDPVDVPAVARLISSDPALAATVLANANSARYGARMSITCVTDAITRLGIRTTREVVSAGLIGSCFSQSQDVEELAHCWRHTFATAILSDELAGLLGLAPGTAYAAGLLHDIGRLALSRVYPQKYISMIQEVSATCVDMVDEEKRLFGVEHTEAGRWLAERWNLPEEFCLVAGRHHDRQEAICDLLGVVHVSCRMATALGFGLFQKEPVEHPYESLPEAFRNRLGRSPEEMCRIIDERMKPFENPVDVPDNQPEPYIGAIPRRHDSELEDPNSRGFFRRLFG